MIEAALAEARHRAQVGDTIDKLWAVIRRDSRLALSYDANFWLSWVGIVVNIVIVYLIGSLVPASPKFGVNGQTNSYFSFLITNIAFLRFQGSAINAFATTIRDGQANGTLEIILSSPTSLPFVVLSSGAYTFGFELLSALIMLAIATLFGLNVSHANVLTLAVFIGLLLAAVIPVGVVASAATIAFKKTGPIEFALTSTTQLFGGVYIPLSTLPVVLQPIGMLLPITHAFVGLRAGLQGTALSQLWPEVGWLVGLCAIFIPTSLWLFTKAVDRAKVEGTLSQY